MLMKRRTCIIVAVFLMGFAAGFYYYQFQDTQGITGYLLASGEQKMVTRVIDGDTVVVEGGEHVRLLGIDTDERGERCYSAAKERLKELVLEKDVILEMDGEDKDRYKRILRYLILDGRNINLMLVEEGLAVAYFYPGNLKYREEIVLAEKMAMENMAGCKWSGE